MASNYPYRVNIYGPPLWQCELTQDPRRVRAAEEELPAIPAPGSEGKSGDRANYTQVSYAFASPFFKDQMMHSLCFAAT